MKLVLKHFIFFIQGLLVYSPQSKSPKFKFYQGFAITQFNYPTDQGQNIQWLKLGFELSIGLAFLIAGLVDSAKYKLDQTDYIGLYGKSRVHLILELQIC
jgi:hypothetical protein